MSEWTAKDMPDQVGRAVIITGANSGIGYESAVAFACKHAHVIMACRSLDKANLARQDLLKRVPDAQVEAIQLDLGNLTSVRNFVEAFNARYDRLDILMNNAGIMGPDYGKTPDGFELQFGTNHLGHFALTGLLLPKLLGTPHSRVVTVASGVYLNGHINFDDLQSERHYDRLGAYSQSKLANVLFTQELQRKLEAAHADVISVMSHPGWTATNLQPNMGSGFQQKMMVTFNPIFAQTPEPGAKYQLYAATAADVHGGDFYGPRLALWGSVVRTGIAARGKDPVTAARLWEVSEQLTGVTYEAKAEPVYAGAQGL